VADEQEDPVPDLESQDQIEVESGSSDRTDVETGPEDVSGFPKSLTIGELKRRTAANPGGPEAQAARRLSEQISKSLDAGFGKTAKRLQEQIAKSTGASRMAEDLARSLRNPAIERLQRQQQEMAAWREDSARQMDEMARRSAEAKQRAEQRADAQAEATIAIAEAQERLQDLQTRGLELATAQAEATAQVAQAQQEMLTAINEELGVLRNQHAVQQRLLHSGWAGGVVMEWTLLVAVVAAVSSVVLGIVSAKEIPNVGWWLAGVAIVCAGVSLAIWQRRRRPRDGSS
jgi:hypothetical protein